MMMTGVEAEGRKMEFEASVSVASYVLKIYLGFVLIRYGKTTDMEIVVMKEEVYIHRSLETGGRPCSVAWGWIKVSQEVEGEGRAWLRDFNGVLTGRNG